MFKINKKMSELILLQRTGYGLKPENEEAVAAAYYSDMFQAYSDIAKHIPNECNSVLDIGCGIGGIDVLIGQKHPSCKFAMLDRDGMEDAVFYGFKEHGAKYNYLSDTREFMVDNGICADNISTFNADKGEWPADKTFNVVLSLISWGFHYPISTYLPLVYNAMTPKSVLILDIRHNSRGYDELFSMFKHAGIVRRFSKCNRVILKK